MAKVLLVEDDNNLREIYEARLQAEGYEIKSAADGEAALVIAKDFKPELIISDVMMPKISGFEMLDILHNTPGLEHTHVIMLTALGQAEDKSRADALGADRYLVKSQVTLEDIVRSAHDVLDDGTATETVPGPGNDATGPVEPAAVASPASPDIAVAAEPEAVNPDEPVAQADEPVPSPTSTTATPDSVAEAATEPPKDSVRFTATEPVEPTSAPEAPHTEPGSGAVAVPEVEPAQPEGEQALASNYVPETLSGAAEPGSIASEEAVIEKQIEDFIASSDETTSNESVSTEETGPTEASENAGGTTTPSDPEADAVPVPNTTAPANANDELLNDAVDSLAGKPAVDAQPSGVISPTKPAAAPEAVPPMPVLSQPNDDSVTVGKKKVISPIPSEPKPSLDELLAREEAKEAAASAGATVPSPAEQTSPPLASRAVPATETQPSTPAQPAPDEFDPNSIAL